MGLMAQVDQARSTLQSVNDQLSEARELLGLPKQEAPKEPEEKGFFGKLKDTVSNVSLSDIGHTVLDVAGLVPVLGAPADGINAVWYAAEGDWVNAGLSATGMIPIAGEAATAAKLGAKGVDALRGADEAIDVARATPNNAMEGPVVFRPRDHWTPEQIEQAREYTARSQEVLEKGQLSPTGRVSTKGELSAEATLDAARERRRAADAGEPYLPGQHAGHVPDTTWTGNPQPPGGYMPLDGRVNSSLGRQAQNYPVGYKPTEFRFEE